jgi:hypothetical protein
LCGREATGAEKIEASPAPKRKKIEHDIIDGARAFG